jgi:hypothetical protein
MWVVEFPDSTIQFNPFPKKLALGVNGIIQATTQTGYFANQEWFTAVIPENAFHEGTNQISVFKIIDQRNLDSHSKTVENEIPHYQPNKKQYIWNENKTQYRLIQNPDESFSMVDPQGNKLKIHKKRGGTIEAIKLTLEAMYFIGWIHDWKNQDEKTFFLIFNKDRLVFADQVVTPESAGLSQANETGDKTVNLNNIRVFLMDQKTGIHEMDFSPNAFPYHQTLIPKHQFYGALSYCEDERTPAGSKTGTQKEKGNNFSNECF